ncbi:hypothetical protein [Pseudoalteromonas sp. T1lg48]|uniref:hypothetical protein n=1 Tax=Pseudoalteromonas sp. T1lg48 TaxID=2077100 RepID=UPI000CF63226|nr:hypothetical protein [Pseudoalteromonas sp. T1lg48]
MESVIITAEQIKMLTDTLFIVVMGGTFVGLAVYDLLLGSTYFLLGKLEKSATFKRFIEKARARKRITHPERFDDTKD